MAQASFDSKSLRPASSGVTWLVTGAAGFIGMHTCVRLLERGDRVIGLDNLNDYYDVTLKQARLSNLKKHGNFAFQQIDVSNQDAVDALFSTSKPQRVIHLAAQAGVRYSLVNPHAYVDSNIRGFLHILEGCRQYGVEHLVYASSSSVYGGNAAMPFCESQNIDHPVSLYAATKKANEVMAHSYSHLFNLPTTGLRFFTVYGPWGRPDMALFLFAKAMLAGESIDVFNHGNLIRDFTFIDDIVEGIVRVADKPATSAAAFDPTNPHPAISNVPYRVFNIGNNQPTPLMDYIHALEVALNIKAKKNFLPMQPGDVPATAASTDLLYEWVGYKPSTTVKTGVSRFVDWYRSYYKV
jgi:UDP-glucuronate 4-epimerase